MIDNRAQSMLGNEISCSSARFVGLQKPMRTEYQREREKERVRERVTKEREITERLHSGKRAGQPDSKR